jgi:ubiquinone/menaquinone biosynthesis C-methylase UbiE
MWHRKKCDEISKSREMLQPHAILDLPSRFQKGLKIERLLKLSERLVPRRILEIGTGSGGIAYYFAHHPALSCDVTAVDIVDQRQAIDGYRFTLVRDTHLPFDDCSFDVVLSNHVIEHVGQQAAQRHHLSELYRVLKPDGLGYLAVPNRWMLIEPHYRLPFLSWLPPTWRSPYLRLMRRGAAYDCNPLTLQTTEEMLSDTGFRYEYLSTRAFRETLAIEGVNSFVQMLASALPDMLLDHLASINPTLIYRLSRRQ